MKKSLVRLSLFAVSLLFVVKATLAAIVVTPEAAEYFTPWEDYSDRVSIVDGRYQSVTMLTIGDPNSGELSWRSFDQLSPNFATLILPFGEVDLNGVRPPGLNPMGTESFSQVVPAASSDPIPFSVTGLPAANAFSWGTRPAVKRPSIAVARPDFNYVSDKLEFEKLMTSSVTGQRDFDAGPGTPDDEARFVPIGEF